MLYGVPVGGHNTSRAAHGQSVHFPPAATHPPPVTTPQRAHQFSIAQYPQFLLTYADDLFANIKVRKRVSLWPLTLTARADYSRHLRAFQYGLSCRDTLTGGRMSADLATQRLQYEKLLQLGNGAALALTATCSAPGLCTWGHAGPIAPMIGIQWFFGRGAAALGRDNKIDIRRRIPVVKALSVEACGSVEIPVPSAQYAVHDSSSELMFGSADPDSKFHAHLDQLNLVLNL